MTDRKFTPPTEFPAEYVDRNGNKAVILGRGSCEEVPFIGYDAVGDPQCWTKFGSYYIGSTSPYDLRDIPEVTAELEEGETETKKYHDAWLEVEIAELEAKLAKAEAKIVELENKLVEAERALDISCVIIEKLVEDKDDAEQ